MYRYEGFFEFGMQFNARNSEREKEEEIESS